MAALSRRLRPLRGPRVYERLLLASGCPFASNGVRRCPWLAKGYSLLRSRRIRRTVVFVPIFTVALVCLCGASLQFLRASSEHCYTSPESTYLLNKST